MRQYNRKINFLDIKPVKGIDTEKATFTKFGQTMSVKDFVQAGRDGTEIPEMIKAGTKAFGIRKFEDGKETDVIDMNINISQAMTMKRAKFAAEDRLQKTKELIETAKKETELTKKTETKEVNNGTGN